MLTDCNTARELSWDVAWLQWFCSNLGSSFLRTAQCIEKDLPLY